MEVSGQFHSPAALPSGKEPPHPLDRRLGGPQSRSGHCVERKNSQPPPVIEPRSSDRPALSQSLYGLSYPGSYVDNIRMDLKEVTWEGMDWLHLAQDSDQCRAVMNMVTNLRVP
jgi:hypothetical protein